jgi:hypothetical protein
MMLFSHLHIPIKFKSLQLLRTELECFEKFSIQKSGNFKLALEYVVPIKKFSLDLVGLFTFINLTISNYEVVN